MEIELNQELINRCNNQSMNNLGNHIKEIANEEFNSFDSVMEKIKNCIGDFNKEQLELIEQRKKIFRVFVEKSYNEYLTIASQFVPVTIAGPSKYNSNKYQKISNRMDKKLQDINNKINDFYNNTKNMLKGKSIKEDIIEKYRHGYKLPISSDDPMAKEKLQAKLEYLEENHQLYINYNKKARKNGTQQLPSYVLRNSNQNIKSVKARLSQLDKVNNLKLSNYRFENGEVCFDKEDNRVKIYFDEKPSEEIRTELKSHAYKWSPKNSAWQRKLTSDAIYMTKHLFKDIENLQQVNYHTENKKISM